MKRLNLSTLWSGLFCLMALPNIQAQTDSLQTSKEVIPEVRKSCTTPAATTTTQVDYSEQIKLLEEKVALLSDLQSRFDDLAAQNRKAHKSTYNGLYLNVKRAVELQDEIGNIYVKIDKLIKKDKIDNTINRVNNPTSDALGFTFSDVILNSANTVFEKKEFKHIPEAKKSKFTSIVEKIVNNPIVNSVASSFPLTGTIRSVITAASTFFYEPEINLKKDIKKGKLMDVVASINADSGFSSAFIEEYVNNLLPYLNFYETLEKANLDYDFAISDLKRRNKNLGDLIVNTDSLITDALNLPNGTSLSSKLDRVGSAFKYSESSSEDFDFLSIIERIDIQEANNVSKQIGFLALNLSNFYSEYIEIQKAKYDKYIEALQEAKEKLPCKEEDKDKVTASINSVINEINALMKDDALNIFKKELDNIKNIREELIY